MKKILLPAFVLVLFSTVVVVRFVRPVVADADGTIYIRADGSVEGTTRITSVGNVTYYFTGNINDSIVVQKDNIVVDGVGYTLQGTGSGKGVDLTERSNVTIKNMEIKQFVFGIYLNHSSSNSIIENVFVSIAFECVRLYESSNNIIAGNNLIMNDIDGITLYGSSNNNITKNYLMSNYDGIRLYESSNNSITENTVTENYYGIFLASSSDNNIVNNNVTANHGTGISLYWSSNENRIVKNHITSNNLRGMHLNESSNNDIYHNNFVDNTEQVHNINSTNTWDIGYPSGGNYWSDYNGTDTNQDGIGDSPYEIDAGNQDGYPLMGPISFFNAGTWNETLYYVHTISNSTVSDFYFSEDIKLISFNVTGLDGSVGFCRVAIPNQLLWCDYPEQWQVWVNNTLIEDRKILEDTNCTYIYFTYNQSTQNVEVIGVHAIPEFPTWASMLLILIVLTVAITIYKRRLLKTPIQ